MSFILDALRKAEAERQRGQVPGLHGPAVAAAAATMPRARGFRVPLWVGVAALVMLGAVGLWLARAPAVKPAAPANEAARGLGGQAASSVAEAVPAAPAARPTALPLVVSAPAAPPVPASLSTAPAGALADTAAAPRPAARGLAPATVGSTEAMPKTSPIVTQVRRLADLPPDQRQGLPPLVVSGSVWSEQAASRFVVLDGQLLREGDTLAPGLVLVKLAPRTATLRWRDGLIEVPF